MDYNKHNKGFVCFMYGFGRSRAVYAVLMVLVAFLLGFLTLNSGEADVTNLQIALGVMLCGLLLIFVNPKIFIIKLAGYLISLVGVMIALHNANVLGADFNLYFYASLVFGAFMMLMLLSWFVYNARSSEINEI